MPLPRIRVRGDSGLVRAIICIMALVVAVEVRDPNSRIAEVTLGLFLALARLLQHSPFVL